MNPLLENSGTSTVQNILSGVHFVNVRKLGQNNRESK